MSQPPRPRPRLAPATGLMARFSVWVARRQYGPEMTESAAVYARHPRLTRAFVLFNRSVEKPGVVPHRLRELAVLKAATVVECAFCIDIGSDFARRAGLTDAQLLALHDPVPSGLFSADELAVIAFAHALSCTPATADDATAAAIRDRFGDTGLIELSHLVAWENFRARLNVGLGVGPGGFSAGKACALPASAAGAAAVA
jgi:AhpD family alkylhydroperoxidase